MDFTKDKRPGEWFLFCGIRNGLRAGGLYGAAGYDIAFLVFSRGNTGHGGNSNPVC